MAPLLAESPVEFDEPEACALPELPEALAVEQILLHQRLEQRRCRVRRTTNGVGLVVVRLEVSIRERLAQASDDRLDLERRLVRERIGEDVTGGDVDRLLEEIVLENDETSVDGGRVADDVLPVVEHLGGAHGAARDIEV